MKLMGGPEEIMNTPKWVLLTQSLDDLNTRHYHFFDDKQKADAMYYFVSDVFVPTLRPWYEKTDRSIFNAYMELSGGKKWMI